MLYLLSQWLLDWSHGSEWESRLSFLRLFRYITVRSAGAAITALLICWWLGPKVIRWLKQLKFGQEYDDKAECAGGLQARVLSKKGTPTMGGLLIILALLISTMLWAQWNAQVELTLLSVLVLAGLGFYDDYAKIIQQSGAGTPPRVKLVVQFLLGSFVGIYLWNLPAKSELRFAGSKHAITSNLVSDVMLPFYKYPVHVGVAVGVVVVLLAIMGSSNAVNLTDGLDGLAIGLMLIAAGAMTVLAYLEGNADFARYLELSRPRDAAELTIFCAAMTGASLGFLWYNAHPAEIFMGDVGSLALGGGLGTVAVLLKQELLLPFIGGVYVLEALSVILQVGSFKLRGKRIFKMAPLHHHFEALGWAESKVIIRFWIAGLVMALFALTTLKLR